MSTSDDQRDRDTGGHDTDRKIAIPGYRGTASEGSRHRPPSVQRAGAADRARSAGSQRAVRPTGSQRARRQTGAQSSARTTGSQQAVPGARREAGRSGSVTADPQGRKAHGRVAVDDRGGPRGIGELQAELAQDDIRLMARQIARSGAIESRLGAMPTAHPRDRLDGLIKWRAYIAAALLASALVVGLVPILSTSGARSTHAELAAAVQRTAQAVGGAAAPGAVAGWIGDRDLPALKAFFSAQRPRVLEILHSAGFDDIGPSGISIRVDFDGSTLVIGAQVDDGDGGHIVVAADLSGTLVGRKPPPGGLGPAFDEQGGLLMSLLTGAALICGALWAVPILVRRRSTG